MPSLRIKIAALAERYEDLLLMDGYDDCLVGVCLRFGQEPIAIYDRSKVIRRLMKDGMTEEEAVEFYEVNQIGAWMGDQTPCFLDRLT
jgi:hypothetical protein